MVAINRYLILSITTCLVALSAEAQQIQPRIIGLETNEEYMKLLGEDNLLTNKEDSIAVVVESLRANFRLNPDAAAESRDQIISLENQLFELRSRKATVVDSLNVIEQDWVLNNMESVAAADDANGHYIPLLDTADDVMFIYESDNVKLNLSDIDYENLVRSEDLEKSAEEYRNQYIINYENMLSLKSSYDVAASQEEGAEIMEKFISLQNANNELVARLDNAWGFIYDNKSFAYSLLMEMMGFSDVLEQESELMRSAQAEITSKEGRGGCDEILRYLVQKNSMVNYETIVADKLELKSVSDSLKAVSARLKSIEKVAPRNIEIGERLFIDFEPAIFGSSTIYNSSNPIPKTKIYENGTIFRIRLGAFKDKQFPSLFRNTSPISYELDSKRQFCYYAGGYATYEEAMAAQESLKKHGFRSPQVIIWKDGRSHNLTTDPLPYVVSYKIDIEAEALPAEVSDSVSKAGSNISKIGNSKFVVAPLERQSQVDSLVNEIKAITPDISLTVDKCESGLDF